MWSDRSRYAKRNSTMEVTSSLNALLVVLQNSSVCSCGLFPSISHWSTLCVFLEDVWNSFTGKQFSSRVPGDLQEVRPQEGKWGCFKNAHAVQKKMVAPLPSVKVTTRLLLPFISLATDPTTQQFNSVPPAAEQDVNKPQYIVFCHRHRACT